MPSPSRRPTRRRFLLGLGVAGLWSAGMAALAACRADGAGRRLARLLADGALAERVGRAYLELFPDEATAAELTALLYRDLGVRMRLASAATLRRRLAERVRQDFVEDRVVELRGWFLARTEARLAALAVLCAGAED